MILIANINVIHCSNHFVYVHSFPLDNNEIDAVNIPISYIIQRKHQEIKYFSQGWWTGNQEGYDLNTGSLEPEMTLPLTVLGILKAEWPPMSPGGLTNLDSSLRDPHSWGQEWKGKSLHFYHLPGAVAFASPEATLWEPPSGRTQKWSA